MQENKNRYIRTDLALELKDDLSKKQEMSGMEFSTGVYDDSDIVETVIRVTNERGARNLGKPIGTYITLESEKLRKSDEGIHEPFVEILQKHLKEMIQDAKCVLVLGLGNRAVTPDALGPYVVDNLYVTRHLFREGVLKHGREICALCPGVMAQTGIETLQILKAVCMETKPDIVIAVDALAAREPSRLNSTIQICDTGIAPGAGVGNDRKRINEDTLGIKVIAIGVPTVISVSAIVHQNVEELPETLASMFVTPNNIDEAVKRVSYTISEAINRLCTE
ncbi:MAG: GPR endopeptidase [Eubacteriales bacterium]|nr:GPR endopeptidase [Lachnospiraceae bacterium]MDO5126836.1 GPR endopeptidase [Eubacteriales bacterium]